MAGEITRQSPIRSIFAAPAVLVAVIAIALVGCFPLAAASTVAARPDGAVRLTTPPVEASDQNPAFSPDGSRMLFTRFESGYNDGPAGLFLLDLDSGQATRLTAAEDQDNVNLPGEAWDSGSDRIVFSSDRLEADDLWRIAPDGTDFSRITTHTGLPWYIEPSWSPDGQWIVFEASQPGVSEDGRVSAIWKVRADGTGLAQLTGASPSLTGGTEGGRRHTPGAVSRAVPRPTGARSRRPLALDTRANGRRLGSLGRPPSVPLLTGGC